MLGSLRSDLRFAIRALAARPGFSALAVLTLALGIGVNAVAFSAVNALVFKPLRFPDVNTLGWMFYRTPGNPYGLMSWPDYQEIARQSHAFEGIGAGGRLPLSLQDGRSARQVWALFVSSNHFSILRTKPEVGRLFSDIDLAGPDVPVIVSHRFWTEQVEHNDSIAGRTLILNGRTVSIIGVLPDTFQGPGGFYEPEIWLLLDRMSVMNLPARVMARENAWLSLFGRLAPNVTAAQAGAELQTLASTFPREQPTTSSIPALIFAPMTEGHPEGRAVNPIMFIALGIVSLVLVIACFNVAGLLLGRAAEREREISVRAALGASRARIIRQFVIEGLLLALLSGIAAIVVSGWTADLLAAFSLPAPIPQRLHIAIDRRLIGFIAALVACAGILPTLLPALQATRIDLIQSMRLDSSRGLRRSRSRNVFVVAQIAGSTLFLATALLFVRGFWSSAASNPGFETEHLLVAEIEPANYGYNQPRARAFLDALVDRLRAHPGVHHAAVADRVSFYVGYPKVTKISDRTVNVYGVGTDYFGAVGIQLKAGRTFTAREIQSGDGVIVSQTLAAHLWPGRNAVGEWIREGDGRQRQVIGVAADVAHRMLGETPGEFLYRPLTTPEYGDLVTLLVRTHRPAQSFVADLREQIRAFDPNLPLASIKTMEQRMELPLWPMRTAAGFFATCGSLALILAAVGLFGITYLTVSQRTREFGIRAALGATRARVMRLVLGEGLWLTLPGVALGLAAAVIAARILANAIFKIGPADPTMLGLAGALQALVALAACIWPAHRATKADPILALRVE
jgi:putative ABC transport system permease protein